jgi:hypothetical protein
MTVRPILRAIIAARLIVILATAVVLARRYDAAHNVLKPCPHGGIGTNCMYTLPPDGRTWININGHVYPWEPDRTISA